MVESVQVLKSGVESASEGWIEWFVLVIRDERAVRPRSGRRGILVGGEISKCMDHVHFQIAVRKQDLSPEVNRL
jgi:hypothetical protein